jgi:hypothetical protein
MTTRWPWGLSNTTSVLVPVQILEKTNVKIDWDKYVDEDEEKGGFDTTGFGGMVRAALSVFRRTKHLLNIFIKMNYLEGVLSVIRRLKN